MLVSTKQMLKILGVEETPLLVQTLVRCCRVVRLQMNTTREVHSQCITSVVPGGYGVTAQYEGHTFTHEALMRLLVHCTGVSEYDCQPAGLVLVIVTNTGIQTNGRSLTQWFLEYWGPVPELEPVFERLLPKRPRGGPTPSGVFSKGLSALAGRMYKNNADAVNLVDVLFAALVTQKDERLLELLLQH